MSNEQNPPELKIVNVPNVKTPVAFRPNTSDVPLLNSIFNVQEYLLPINGFHPKSILDCGANVGYSAVYFANKYPEAKIVAVEPESSNFKMLRYNTLFYDNISCVQSAMWNNDCYIKIVDRGFDKWGFMTYECDENDPQAMKATTVSKLIADFDLNEIDLLKVDIEGAEKEMFSENNMTGGGYTNGCLKSKLLQ